MVATILTPKLAIPSADPTDLIRNMPAVQAALAQRIEAILLGDTPWLTLTGLASGWTIPASTVAQAKRVANRVYLRGNLVNTTFTGGYTAIAALPAGLLPAGVTGPSVAVTFPAIANTPAVRSVQVATNGQILAYATGTTAAWFPLDAVSCEVNL